MTGGVYFGTGFFQGIDGKRMSGKQLKGGGVSLHTALTDGGIMSGNVIRVGAGSPLKVIPTPKPKPLVIPLIEPRQKPVEPMKRVWKIKPSENPPKWDKSQVTELEKSEPIKEEVKPMSVVEPPKEEVQETAAAGMTETEERMADYLGAAEKVVAEVNAIEAKEEPATTTVEEEKPVDEAYEHLSKRAKRKLRKAFLKKHKEAVKTSVEL